MDVSLTENAAKSLLREAQAVAKRTCRRLRLPIHDADDLRQDLLVDLVARLQGFRRERGTLGAFANVVFRNKASRISASIRRERATLGFYQSIDEQLVGDCSLTLGDILPESSGYEAMLGQRSDEGDQTELRLSIQAALACLSAEDRRLCNALSVTTMQGLVRSGFGKRSTLYRHRERVRLDLVALGVGGLS